MSVRHSAVITCNQCGTDKSVDVSGSFFSPWHYAPEWLQVTHSGGSGFVIGTDTPEQARDKIPDLCSWDCVMLYASEKAISYKEKRP